MTWAQFGTIAATDYNTLVGGNPTTTANTLNATWATGGTTAGYGQTAAANVAVGGTVNASNWAALVSNTASAATHQGSGITAVGVPTVGGIVTYLSAIQPNLNTIYSARLNAATQGSTTANTATIGTTWSQLATFTHTVTFANGNAARYFFNSGGQLAITCAQAGASGINLLFNNLCSNVGTVVMSAPTSGAVTIAGTSYNGITKVGGGGNAPTISSGSGYYAMTTSNATVFTQTASTGPSGYLSTFIRILAKSNGTQGVNGDTGSVINIYTIWDEVPDGLVVATGGTTTLTVRPPETTNLANSWGTISVTGTVAVV